MSTAAVIPSLLPLFVVIAMRRAEARIHRQLADTRAFDPESAVPLSLRRRWDSRRIEALIRGGAIHMTAGGHYFLDADGWGRYQHNRRQRAMFAVSTIVALLGVGFAVVMLLR